MEPLQELVGERRRFGYRRLHLWLAREGVVVNRNLTLPGWSFARQFGR